MNILITRFPYESSFGGEEHHTIELAKHCRDSGHNVMFAGSCHILLEEFTRENFDVQKVSSPKMPVTPLSLLATLIIYPFLSLKFYFNFTKIFREEEIDVLYCLSLLDKIILTPIAHERHIRVVWVEHQQIRNWLLKSPLKYLYTARSKFAKIVPVCEWNKKILIEKLKVGKKNIIEILNGVSHPELKKYSTSIKDQNLIGACSRLIKKKGIDILIRAFNIVTKKDPQLSLTIIGDGPERKNLESLIANLKLKKKVKLFSRLETRDDYLSEISKFTCFVLPSIDESETFGLVVAEAMSLGSTVVVTDACGIANYLHDGKDSFIAKRNNVESLAEKICLALSAESNVTDRSIKLSEQIFDEEKSMNQYLKLFEI